MMQCHCSFAIRVGYIGVKRLFRLLYNHWTTTHLECILSPSCGWSEYQPHSFTINDGSISMFSTPEFFFFAHDWWHESVWSVLISFLWSIESASLSMRYLFEGNNCSNNGLHSGRTQRLIPHDHGNVKILEFRVEIRGLEKMSTSIHDVDKNKLAKT